MIDDSSREAALADALTLAVVAPTDEQSDQAAALAVKLAAGIDSDTLDRVMNLVSDRLVEAGVVSSDNIPQKRPPESTESDENRSPRSAYRTTRKAAQNHDPAAVCECGHVAGRHVNGRGPCDEKPDGSSYCGCRHLSPTETRTVNREISQLTEWRRRTPPKRNS